MVRTNLAVKVLFWLALILVVAGGLYQWQNAPIAQAATQTVSTCDETHLEAAINTASAGDTVNFSCSGVIALTGTINISKDLTLDGSSENVTLSGNHAVSVLNVSSGINLTINNLTIDNGYIRADNCFGNVSCGGGIYNNGNLTIINSSITNNWAYNYDYTGIGGGIFNTGNLTVTNSIFTGNSTASSGGAIANYGKIFSITNSTFNSNGSYYGGAIENYQTATIGNISSCVFDSNNSNYEGGGIKSDGNIDSISNSTFISNSAAYFSGGIENDGTLNTIVNSTFIANNTRYGSGFGGAIYNGMLINSISNSTFISNSSSYGGAISDDVTIGNISNSTFVANSSSYGALYVGKNKPITVTNSLLDDNSSNCSLGIIDGGYNLSNDNSCAFIATGSQGNVKNLNLSFLSNNGGSTQTIALLSGSAAIGAVKTNCPATDQRGVARPATSCDAGAFQTGIIGNGTDPTLCTEPALNAALGGGGYISVQCPPSTTITVTSNPDTTSNFRAISGTVTLDASPSVSFTLSGGNNYQLFTVNSGSNFTINSLAVADSKNSNAGGVNNSGIFTATNSSFISNTGAAIFNNNSIIVSNTNFINNNNSGTDGGAIVSNGNINLVDSNFYNNIATVAGAIYSTGNLNVDNSSFYNNKAIGYSGGAILASGTLIVTNSTFDNNAALTENGGAIANSGFATISGSTFNNNTANIYNSGTGNGGAILNSSILTITKSTFYNNTAIQGGAIFNVSGSTINLITNSTIVSNSASNGGAIFSYGWIKNLTDTTFSSNSASNGGAIDNLGLFSTLANATFSSNSANNGGAINIGTSINNITNTTFYSNTASSNGGAIYNRSYLTNLGNSTFYSNTATTSGGAIYSNAASSANITLTNNILARNKSDSNCSGPIGDNGYNLSDDSSCISASTSISNVTNLKLGTLGNYGGSTQTIPLLIGSAAIGFVATGCPATDQRGVERPATNCDAGAYQASASISVASTPNPSTYGQPVTFTATVSPMNATGTVSFTLNSTVVTSTLTNGVTTYVTNTLPVGSDVITATYSGDISYTASTSNTVSQTVNPASSSILLTSTPNPSTYGQPVTFTATITPIDATGTVTFTLGSTSVSSIVVNGAATYVTSTLPVGSDVITATYSGDVSYTASTSNIVTQTVNPIGSNITVSSSVNPSIYGQPVTFTATIATNNSTATHSRATGDNTVSFTIDGNTVATELPITNNIATYVTSTLSVGNHSVVVSYIGSATTNSSTSSVLTQTVSKTTPTVNLVDSASVITQGQTISFTATVSSSVGTPSGTVTFFDGATQLGSPVTITNGVATFSTNTLSVDTHSITATYNGDINFNAATSTAVTVTVNGSNNGNGNNTYTYYLPYVANNFNHFTTYLAFQNIGTASANITVTYYDEFGNTLAASTLITQVAQYAEALPGNPFTNGKQGAGIITSDQPLNVIVPEATPYGGSAYAVSSGSSNNLIAPFALNNAFGDFTTQLNILNGGSSAVTATVTFYGTIGNATAITSTSTSVTIQAHTTTSLNQNTLPSGFSGWAQISGSADTLVAQVLEQSPSQKFVAIANAATSASSTLYAPAIFDDGYGGFYTGANIVNPNANGVTVTLTYYDLTGKAIPTNAFSIPAHGVASVFNGSNNGNGIPSGGLPNGFIGAVAVNSVGGGVVMSVNENGGLTAAGNSRSGTYAAIANGGSTVGLPVVSNGGYTYITGDTIFNTSSQPVTATFTFYNTDGRLVAWISKVVTIAPHASAANYQGDGSLPNDFYGTVIITETDGPANALIVTTNAQNSTLFYTYAEPNS